MDKIITDNTKVNVNLLKRVQELEEENEELKKNLLPTDKEMQKWGERYANQHFERSDNPLSEWWIEAETYTNGCREVVNYVNNVGLKRVQELETELEKELIFFQAWMVRYAKDPKDINLINDYLKTKK